MYKPGELPRLVAPDLACADVATRVRLALVAEPGPDLVRVACVKPAVAARIIAPLVCDEPQEVLGALLLDGRYRPVGYTIPYRGTATKAHGEVRGLFVPALLVNATAIILFHNHPSGDPTPSHEDRSFTLQMRDAGDLLGVRLLDHLVIGTGERFVSLRERGLWD